MLFLENICSEYIKDIVGKIFFIVWEKFYHPLGLIMTTWLEYEVQHIQSTVVHDSNIIILLLEIF